MSKRKNQIDNIIKKLIEDHAVRIAAVTASHSLFFPVYFSHYMEYETAPFQHEMFAMTEDEETKLHVIVAFRGSAKSTIFTMSYPLWSILGKQQKKFILLLSQTQPKAQQNLANIRKELESNELLRRDLGPFQEERNQWGAQSLIIPRFDAKITIGSVEQSIRGLRHGPYRPDLIILDDVEDTNSVRTREGRDKTWQWFTNEIIPAGAKDARIIAAGNLLHEDSLLKRLQQRIQDGKMSGIYREYPVVDAEDNLLWPGKYPDEAALKAEEERTGDPVAWKREFLLQIVPPGDQIIRQDWIQFYDEMPSKVGYKYRWTKIGIDLAISTNTSADYTAMVGVSLFGHDANRVVYVHPFPINKRMDFPTTLEEVKHYATMLGDGRPVEALVEDVAYQRAFSQQLVQDGYPAKEVKVGTQDRRTRVVGISPWIKSGRVLFPREGCEELIEQLVGFGVETHDDLVDALVIAVNAAIEARDGNRVSGRVDLL